MQKIAIDRIRRFRYLLGATMLFAGSAALWVAPGRGFADQPVGWVLIAASMLLLFYRNYIEVNPAAGRLAHRTGLGFGFIRKRFDIGTVKHIELKSLKHTDDEGTTTEVFAIEVKGSGGGSLCEHEEMFAARLIAEQLARALGVPLENHLFDGRSARKPEDLDLPIAERWRRAGQLKVAPIIEGASTLDLSHEEDFSEISMPVQKFPRVIAGVVGVLLIAGLLMLSSAFVLSLFAVPMVAFGTIWLITRYSGRDTLRFHATAVSYRRGLMPSPQRMNIAAIEEILEHGDYIVLMGDREFVRIERPEGEYDRALLRQFVERQLSQRQVPLATD